MAIGIRDGETDRLARVRAEPDSGRAARLLAIGDRCAGHMRGFFTSGDHGDLLYDEVGLPR